MLLQPGGIHKLDNTSVLAKKIKRNEVSHITPYLYGYAKVCFGYIQVVRHCNEPHNRKETDRKNEK